MRRTTILPAILAVMPATVFLTAQASLSEPAAEECKTKPGSSTPPGGHWYYRVNRADKRHCWFLSPVELHVRRGDQAQTPVLANDATSVAEGQPILSAALAQTAAETDFAARWPENLPPVEDASFVKPPSVSSSYADTPPAIDTAAEMPSRWTAAEKPNVRTTSVGEVVLDYISLAGLMTTASLLLAGWAAKFARRPMPRQSDWRRYSRPAAERHVRSSSPRSDRPAGRSRPESSLGGAKTVSIPIKRRTVAADRASAASSVPSTARARD